MAAQNGHGDAVRVYLVETGGAVDAGQVESASIIPRLRTAGDIIADIVPPPPGVYPRARKVLERHATALCARMEKVSMQEVNAPAVPEISDDFVPALRADAAGTPEAAKAALPLVTVAANLGELEVTYPAPPS